ncbi:MAG TPA: hypothetical protein VHJ38_13735 [Nitrososphaeraceae archaeon]|nr:hypothetical protein [Nitrososphaeraceae archaeon]
MIVYLFTKVVVVTAIKLPHFTSAGSLSVSLQFPPFIENSILQRCLHFLNPVLFDL